jgi:hypothetical protein
MRWEFLNKAVTFEHRRRGWRGIVRRCSRVAAISVLGACLALRAVTPAGYMPGSIADGTPFVLCPGSTPGASYFLAHGATEHSHHHHHDQGAADKSPDIPWDTCPFGAAFAVAAPTHESLPSTDVDKSFVPALLPPTIVRPGKSRVFRARGPPAYTS